MLLRKRQHSSSDLCFLIFGDRSERSRAKMEHCLGRLRAYDRIESVRIKGPIFEYRLKEFSKNENSDRSLS